jgi:hypothetical protein
LRSPNMAPTASCIWLGITVEGLLEQVQNQAVGLVELLLGDADRVFTQVRPRLFGDRVPHA